MKRQDILTNEGRAKERARRIAQTATASMVSKLINIAAALVTVPLTLPYLGLEQFGIWMTITGFIAFLSFTDLGISIGLQSSLIRNIGKPKKTSKLISTSFLLITCIAIILCLTSIYIIPETNISELIKLENPENKEILTKTVQVVVIVFALGLPAGLVQRIFESYQNGLTSNILLIVGRTIGLASIYASISLNFKLQTMIAIYMGAPFIIMLLGGMVLFLKYSHLRPSFKRVDIKSACEISKVGGLALFAQLGASIMSSGPTLVLASLYGAAAIVPFSITQRLFGVVSIILSSALSPLWPAYGEAKLKGDIVWIRKTFTTSVKFTLLISIPAFLFFLFLGQWTIGTWTQDQSAVPDWPLLMACNFWMILLSLVRVNSMFLNGLDKFTGQAIYGILLPCLAIALGYAMGNTISLTTNLIIMITTGELLRVLLMSKEIHLSLKSMK